MNRVTVNLIEATQPIKKRSTPGTPEGKPSFIGLTAKQPKSNTPKGFPAIRPRKSGHIAVPLPENSTPASSRPKKIRMTLTGCFSKCSQWFGRSVRYRSDSAIKRRMRGQRLEASVRWGTGPVRDADHSPGTCTNSWLHTSNHIPGCSSMLRQIRTLGLSGYATEFGFPENSYRRSTRNLRSGSCHPDLGGLATGQSFRKSARATVWQSTIRWRRILLPGQALERPAQQWAEIFAQTGLCSKNPLTWSCPEILCDRRNYGNTHKFST